MVILINRYSFPYLADFVTDSYRRKPDVGSLYMEEWRSCNVCNWWSNLLPRMYHVNSKCIYCISTYVIPIHPGYKNLALVIVNEQSTNHFRLITLQLRQLNFQICLRRIWSTFKSYQICNKPPSSNLNLLLRQNKNQILLFFRVNYNISAGTVIYCPFHLI